MPELEISPTGVALSAEVRGLYLSADMLPALDNSHRLKSLR